MDLAAPDVPRFLFSWIDYCVFAFLLSLSALIGIYFGLCGKQNSTNEYLFGGKTMKPIPVAVSLVASYVSGITILAVPSDVYKFGANYIWVCVCMIITTLITTYVFLPVFFKLQYTTIFEYLNVRFDRKIRILASFLFTITLIIYIPIVIYIPALAFSQASGISVHLITPVISLICIFYTTIGGLKAVIWTDTLQFVGIVGSTVTILCMGISAVGGFDYIFKINVEGERLDLFNFGFNPTIRDGAWAYLIGATTFWTSQLAIHQGTLQKLLSVPTIGQAKQVMLIYCFGIVILVSISVFTGNILYAKYSQCDPLTAKLISRSDQILPYFVMDIAGSIPGLPGIFIGGVFCAALSTLSACLNTISGTIYQDFILPFLPKDITQKMASNILKLIVVVTGVLCILLVFVIENMGGMLALVAGLQGIVGGPQLGLFILGVLFPVANSKGALIGGVTGLLITSWIAFENQWYAMQGLLRDFSKPVSVEGCDFNVNVTKTTLNVQLEEEPFILYQISFWYNTFIGTVLVIVIGLIVSLFTKEKNTTLNLDLFSPVIHSLISSRDKIIRDVPEVHDLKSISNHNHKNKQNGIGRY